MIKPAKEVDTKRATEELGVPKNTLGTWVHKAKKGKVDPEKGEQTPETALTPTAENRELRRQLKAQAKEINRLSAFLPQAVGSWKKERLKFIAAKTENGTIKGKKSAFISER